MTDHTFQANRMRLRWKLIPSIVCPCCAEFTGGGMCEEHWRVMLGKYRNFLAKMGEAMSMVGIRFGEAAESMGKLGEALRSQRWVR